MPTASTGGYATVARVRIPLMATVAAKHPDAMESIPSSGNRQKSFRRKYKRAMGRYSEMIVKHCRFIKHQPSRGRKRSPRKSVASLVERSVQGFLAERFSKS
jgi:hypothetical protein